MVSVANIAHPHPSPRVNFGGIGVSPPMYYRQRFVIGRKVEDPAISRPAVVKGLRPFLANVSAIPDNRRSLGLCRGYIHPGSSTPRVNENDGAATDMREVNGVPHYSPIVAGVEGCGVPRQHPSPTAPPSRPPGATKRRRRGAVVAHCRAAKPRWLCVLRTTHRPGLGEVLQAPAIWHQRTSSRPDMISGA